MSTDKTDARNEVSKLQTEIEKLTNRKPASTDRIYLMQRLKELRARVAAGDDLRHRKPVGCAVISVSMTLAAREEFGKIMEKENMGTSDLIKRALVCWAAKEGHKGLTKALST